MKKLISAWKYNCPRCRKGDLFTKPFEIGKPLSMPYSCEVCEQRFEPEPGYYYGAMFLSYIISSGILLPIALLLVFYFKWSVNAAMAMIIFIGVIFYIRILRFSRALWIHLMVKYNPRYIKKER